MLIRDADAFDEPLLRELAEHGDDLALQTASALHAGGGRPRVAVRDGDLLGAAVSVKSEWHPHWAWAHIVVRPEYRRQGVASALADDLEQSVPALKAKVRPASAAWEFTRRRGWGVLHRSEIWEVDSGATRTHPEEVQLNVDVDQVADAYFRFYERSHRWDPVGPTKGPADIYASHVHDVAATLLVFADGMPAAVACLWHADAGLEFSGGACRDGASRQVALLMEAAVAWASGAPLLVEVDTNMTEVHDALRNRSKRLLDSVEIRGSRGRDHH